MLVGVFHSWFSFWVYINKKKEKKILTYSLWILQLTGVYMSFMLWAFRVRAIIFFIAFWLLCWVFGANRNVCFHIICVFFFFVRLRLLFYVLHNASLAFNRMCCSRGLYGLISQGWLYGRMLILIYDHIVRAKLCESSGTGYWYTGILYVFDMRIWLRFWAVYFVLSVS